MTACKTVSFIILLLIITVTLTVNAVAQPFGYGAIYEEEPPSWMKPSPPIIPLDGYDESCDLSPNFPPIKSQGGQGSCTAWAVGYYFKGYQEWLEHGWDLTDENHQFSPAFVYNLINGGADNGSAPSDAFKVLCDLGCANWSMMPYSDQNLTNFPTEEAFYQGISYRSQDAFTIDLYVSLDDIKAHLLNGHAATISFPVYPNFDNIGQYNNIYCLSDIYGDAPVGHSVTLCGFDDDMVTNDGLGAFKVANSWGPGWGEDGYFYFTYQAIQSQNPVMCWQYAYYCTDRDNYTPTTLAVIRVDHEDRFGPQYRFGIGDPASPIWYQTFFDFGFTAGTTTARPYPASNIIIDISDGASYLNPTQQNDLYIRLQDANMWNGIAGQLTDFTVVDLTWPANSTSDDTPVNILDNGTWTYAYLQITQGNSTPVNGAVSGTWDLSGSPYIVTDDVIVGSGSSLIIEPGTEVIFLDDYKFEVADNGDLQAVGTETDQIVFKPLLSVNGWKGIWLDGASDDSRLEYCRIRDGIADGVGDEENGGGIFCRNSNPTITNCIIERCVAVRGAGIYLENANPAIVSNTISENIAEEDGGALYCHASDPEISQNMLLDNTAVNGAAICCYNSQPSISGNTLQENGASGSGGGIHCDNSTSLITSNMFIFNTAGSGGAISAQSGSPVIELNSFIDNDASQGGAIYGNQTDMTVQQNSFFNNDGTAGGAIRGYESTVNIINNTMTANTSGSGGGVNLWFCDGEVRDNQITDNDVTGFGGAVYCLGSQIAFVNDLFAGNSAGNGGGLFQISSSAELINCTIVYNETASSGGGIANTNGSDAAMLNCIVYHNETEQIHVDGDSEFAARYCDIEGSWTGEGNFAERPWFAGETDYSLADWSPCIGSGTSIIEINGTNYAAPDADIEGNVRPNPAGSDPDIGAYENELGIPTAVEPADETVHPSAFSLQPCFPNPFNPTTTIRFDLPIASRVRLDVFDISGSRVGVGLAPTRQYPPGFHTITFDGSRLSSGIYIYRLSAGKYQATGKMVLMK